MNQGKFVFAQLFSFVSPKIFAKFVKQYKGDYKVKEFSCWKQFLCMSFGQLTQRDSLSDTVICLNANRHKLYHLGIGDVFSKTTLSRANESRDWRIYADFCYSLIREAQELYLNDDLIDIDLKNNVFAIDATTIDLCLSAFYWAKFRRYKGGIKVHAQLDLKTQLPSFLHITTASVHELKVLDLINFEPDSFYVLDRGYIDFDRFYKINSVGAFFITRARKDFSFIRKKSNVVDKTTGLLCDQIITLNPDNFYTYRDYPIPFRRIKYYDNESDKTFVFITNNLELDALKVAQLYKHRWKIELFFKWIKQHLKIKSFWGQSENAVKTQIWIAISNYVLVAIVKKRLQLTHSLYEILQVISISVLERISINELLQKKVIENNQGDQSCKQLKIFDL